MAKPAALLALIFLISCHTPEAELARLQHDFWEKFARQDFFEIRLKQAVLRLPLPPLAEPSGQQIVAAEKLRQRANSIEKEKLSLENQRQLTQLRKALDDCVARSGSPLFDPSSCCISETLQQYAGHPEMTVLLEKMQLYYVEIEKRWQKPDIKLVPKAIATSQATLDQLDELEKNSGKAQITPMRAAIKDFIGLCQSAFLQ